MGPEDPDFEVQAGGVRLASALRALQTQGLFCDIAISAGNEQYFAHQVVLASRSKMLHDHILSQSKDQGSPAPELSLPPQPLEIRLSADMAAQEACCEALALLDRLYGKGGAEGGEASQLSEALEVASEASLALGLQGLQAKGLLCDILLTVGDIHIPAHQAVLAASSSALKRLILDGAKQLCDSSAKMPCNTFELEMRGIKHAEAIRVLVDFLYGSPTWTKHQVSEEVCADILHLASELRLPKLQEQALQWSRSRTSSTPGEEAPLEAQEAEDPPASTPVELPESQPEAEAVHPDQLECHKELEECGQFWSMKCVRFNSTAPIPMQPKMGAKEAAEHAGEIYCRQDGAFLERLVQLFWERPVWLESGLKAAPVLAKLMDADRLRRLLPFVAYQWKDGPWQQAYARLGWDPREEPEDALQLQVIVFKDTTFPAKGRESPEVSEDIYFSRPPTRRWSLYMLELIEDNFIDSLVQSLVQGAAANQDRPQCDRKTGFLGQAVHEAILDRLEVMATQLRQKRKKTGVREAPRKKARGN